MDSRFSRIISFLTCFSLFALYAPFLAFCVSSCSSADTSLLFDGTGGAGGIVATPDAGPCFDTTAESSTSSTSSTSSSSSSESATSSSSSSSSSGCLPPTTAENPCSCADKSIFDACGEDGLGNCHSSDGQSSPVLSCWYRCLDLSGQTLPFNTCPNPCTLQLGGMKTWDPYP